MSGAGPGASPELPPGAPVKGRGAMNNPVTLITKNHLVTRDVDLLAELAAHDAAAVALSVTPLDRSLQRLMEPRTSVPDRRLEAMRVLSEAGVPVRVMVAPVIPGLTDREIPSILEAAAEAGATRARGEKVRTPATSVSSSRPQGGGPG